MIKKKIFALSLILITLTFFACKDRFDTVFYFGGKEYKLSKTVEINYVKNLFYTPKDTDMALAESFIQLIVFDEKVSVSNSKRGWKQILGTYGLEPISDDSEGYFGDCKRNNLDLVSYGTKIMIDGKDAYICYLLSTPEDFDTDLALDSAESVIDELVKTGTLFQK